MMSESRETHNTWKRVLFPAKVLQLALVEPKELTRASGLSGSPKPQRNCGLFWLSEQCIVNTMSRDRGKSELDAYTE